nr:embryonal Fyn-associated substrate-like [Paramormyrops kingsleyae]
MSLSTALAKALFDNAAESPEELAFRKGDILMVLDQEGGGPGWWLCSLHGRQGIAPANRLRLLNTSQPCSSASAETSTPASCPTVTRPHGEESVYLSPGPHPRPTPMDSTKGPRLGEEVVYQSPPALSGPAAAALRRGEGRPRSRSSSGTRPRPEWDVCATGRARSPSLRGRGSESGSPKQQVLYQTPTAHRLQGGLAPEAVYLSPCGVPRATTEGSAVELGGSEAMYHIPREAVVAVGNSDGCYLVPRVSVPPSDVYQTPTGGAVLDPPQGGLVSAAARRGSGQLSLCSGTALTTQTKLPQEAGGLYQTPTLVGGLPKTPQNGRKLPGDNTATPAPVATGLAQQRLMPFTGEGSPRAQPKVLHKMPGGQSLPSTPPSARGRLPQTPPRSSPVLPRTAVARVQGSPNFARKPPPPAPPVRGVTRKDTPQSHSAPQQGKQGEGPRQVVPNKPEGRRDEKANEESDTKKINLNIKRDREEGEYEEPDDENLHNQVYDTPPASRWQHAVPAALPENDDSIYNTPRMLPPHGNQGSEVYDVPTLNLSVTPDLQQPTYNIPASLVAPPEPDDDVYSVPTLPGLSATPSEVPDGPGYELQSLEVYCVPGPGKRIPDAPTDGAPCPEVPTEGSDRDCGIYDMPALSLDIPMSATRRASVSSTGSCEVQGRASLSALIQSALGCASPSTPPRELATSLSEILSVWKACQAADAPPPLHQAWTHLSDLLPMLSACSSALTEAQLSLVRRALEDSAALLQSQALPPSGRPRLPSQESLSRRPLPALPVAEVKPLNVGMGGRKGSWIQERPLPPPPPPSFPLPPVAPPHPCSDEEGEGEELGNEYAGIGLSVAPLPCPGGDSVGYVKLQGKPDPPPVIQTSTNPPVTDPTTTEQRSSPSPPLPVSLSLEDSELLAFYSSQSLSHLSCLADSIDALFTSVQGNQPPRVFVSRGKSLIVTAHKLVFIGDTLSRLLTSPDLRTKVTTSGGRLCQALKAVVVATKGAAQNYPSAPATQEMVDRVAELSQHAAGFSGLLQRLAEIS